MQTDKLKKLLALTTSDNDNEALAAIKQANKILIDSKKTWSDVFTDLTEANNKYERLLLSHKALIDKYDMLVKQRQVVVVPTRPVMPGRRARRL